MLYEEKITDKLLGWEFLESNPVEGMTYNEFEGYYPDKGGKLTSPEFKLDKKSGESAYFRIMFDAAAPERAYQGIDFYDAYGNKLPDLYDVIYPGARRGYERVFYAMGKADKIRVFFQSKSGVEVWNVKIEKVTSEVAAEYCDKLYATVPELNFTAEENALKLLPGTQKALDNNKPWRVVMLGDSIMQDTFHSLFHALIKRHFPNSNFDFVISMRGGTGCWHYCKDDNFQTYVEQQKPDLLIIGGISNYCKEHNPTGNEAIEMVAKKARQELGCEVLILSATLSVDTRKHNECNLLAGIPAAQWDMASDSFALDSYDKNGLAQVSERLGIPVWDMMSPTYTWLFASGKPFEFYSRDKTHSGEIGKQIIGRTLLQYFLTSK